MLLRSVCHYIHYDHYVHYDYYVCRDRQRHNKIQVRIYVVRESVTLLENIFHSQSMKVVSPTTYVSGRELNFRNRNEFLVNSQ